MNLDHVLVLDEHGNTIGRIVYARDGWDWRCSGCQGRSTEEGYRSAGEALADFEAHVERRHP